MKILVTGGAGFIGSHLVDALVQDAHRVLVVDNLSTGKEENVNKDARLYRMDVRDPALPGLVQEEAPRVVFHLAGQISVSVSLKDPSFDADVNLLGSLNLLQGCVKAGVEKLVFASSAAIYGTPKYLPLDEQHPLVPLSGYGLSKLTVEHYLEIYRQQHGLEYTACRYANVYGERQDTSGEGGVVAIFVDSLLRREAPTIFGDGLQTRDFIYVQDVVRASLRAMSVPGSQVLNISTGRASTVNELFQILADHTRAKVSPVYAKQRPGDIRHSVLDHRRAIDLLGWKPDYDLKAGLTATLDKW